MTQVKRELLKKITLANCGATPDLEKLIAAPGKQMVLLTIIGIASAHKVGQTDKGEYVRFIGQFKATNVETGVEYVSPSCILPGSAPDLIYGALAGAGEGEKRAVEFAFNIGARYDPTAITKYVYTIEQIIQTDESDPLALLEAKFKNAALPAPTAPAEPQPEEKPAGKGKGK